MKPTTARIVVTVFVLLVIIIRLIWPTNPLDITMLILLGFLLLIWFGQVLFKSMTLPGGLGVEFQEDSDIKAEAKAKVEKVIKQTALEQQPSIKWDKVATLFWLGNDLMWIEDMTYRYARPERVLQGVDNVLRYFEDLGFVANSFPVQELTLAKQALQNLPDLSRETYRQVLQEHYRGIRQHIETVKFYTHSLANIQQPGFEKLRAL
jgi:hypothetical protein